VALVAEVLGHGQPGEAHTESARLAARSSGKDHCHLVIHTPTRASRYHRSLPSREAFAYAGKDREALVHGAEGADQLCDDGPSLPTPGRQDADLAARVKGAIRSITLTPVSRNWGWGDLFLEGWAKRWIGIILLGHNFPTFVNRFSQHVKYSTQRGGPTGTL